MRSDPFFSLSVRLFFFFTIGGIGLIFFHFEGRDNNVVKKHKRKNKRRKLNKTKRDPGDCFKKEVLEFENTLLGFIPLERLRVCPLLFTWYHDWSRFTMSTVLPGLSQFFCFTIFACRPSRSVEAQNLEESNQTFG